MNAEYNYHFEDKGRSNLEGPTDFKTTHFNDEDAETSLTRELIQNALDAVDPDLGKPVEVVYELRSFELQNLQGLKGLTEASNGAHHQHSKDGKEKDAGVPSLGRVVDTLKKTVTPVLRVGDYNTKGLTGSENDLETPSALAVLTRTDGVTEGGSGRGGSYGIRSASARLVSDLRTAVYISKPMDAPETVYASTSHLAGWKTNDGIGKRTGGVLTRLGVLGEDVEYPCGDANFAGFEPRIRNGTDVYALGCSAFSEDPSLDRIKRSVFVNFFVAIAREKLAVRGLDLPAFFAPVISRRMAPEERGAHEEESIHRRADGHRVAGCRSDVLRGSLEEAQGQRTNDLCLGQAFRPDRSRRRQTSQGAQA